MTTKRLAAGSASLAVLLLTGCGSVTPVVTEVPAGSRGSYYATMGVIDPASACAATPTPTAPDVTAWWAGIDTTTRTTKVVTGFEIWSNTNPGCATSRLDGFRGRIAYPLASIAALSTAGSPIVSRINSATLRLSIEGRTTTTGPQGTRCEAPIGGVAGIAMLRPGSTMSTGLTQISPPDRLIDQDANASQVESFATEFRPIPLPGTRDRATFSVGGAGITIVDLDVKDYVLGALNRGDANMTFLLFGPLESASALAGDLQLDCKMLVTPGMLTVRSL